MSLEIPESGFVTVKIGEASASIDLYSANNQLASIYAEVNEAFPGANNAKLAHERLSRVCDLLESLNLGRVSHYSADQFETAIFDAFDALKKASEQGSKPV